MSVISLHRPALVRRSSAYSSLECRFAAFLIDSTLFVFVQSFTIYLLIGYPSTKDIGTNLIKSSMAVFSSNLDYIGQFMYANVYFLLIHFLYYTILESSAFKGTIGKRVLGLKVKTLSGGRISYLQAVNRYITRILSIGVFFMGFAIALTNPRHQTLHDIISGCTVRVKRLH
jgi:uncharacterized RDD family membrane protein YckC